MKQTVLTAAILGLAGLGLSGLTGAIGLAASPGSAPKPPTQLADLAWLSGLWEGDDGKLAMEELWLPPKGGMMAAIHRDYSIAKGKTVSFEFLRIEETRDGLVYLAMPQGRPATPFKLVEGGPERLVFENKAHDFPTRILYWRTPDGLLHARIEGTMKGQPASEEWTWKRSK